LWFDHLNPNLSNVYGDRHGRHPSHSEVGTFASSGTAFDGGASKCSEHNQGIVACTHVHFKVVTLQEPPKVEVLKYLEAEHGNKPLPAISRKAFINYYIRNTVCLKMR
jgi:hypothetical protein